MSSEIETGISGFLDRMNLTARLEARLAALLRRQGVRVMRFGQEILVRDNGWTSSRLKKLDTKASETALMVKFSPDYVVLTGGTRRRLFFIDAKVSITPIFFATQIERIRQHSGEQELRKCDAGEIEREAWYSYNTFYPKDEVALVMASPYCPSLVLAEWVANVRCLWCYRGRTQDGLPTPWDCRKCALRSEGSFGVVVNEFAGGSGTPHTNIDFRSMRTLQQFLHDELDVSVAASDEMQKLREFVSQWPLGKPRGNVNWMQYNGTVRELEAQGCSWLKYRLFDRLFDTYEEFAQQFARQRASAGRGTG
jgi:hypothetical protein